MMDKKLFNNLWAVQTRFIKRFAVWILLFFLILSGTALYYAAGHIGIDSDTAKMFDASLAFRKNQKRFNKFFSVFHKNFVIVVDAQNPEAADRISHSLASKLQQKKDLYEDVYVPGGGEFFKKNAFLFLSESKLDSLSKNLAQSQVLFSLLAQNYSLRGFFTFLNQVLSMGNETQISKLDPLLGQVNQTIQARLQGNPHPLSWQSVMSDSAQMATQRRRFIQVKPHLDYTRLMPSKPAIDSVRSIINRNHFNSRASIRITGNQAMAYEEMQSVMRGALLAGILAFILVSLTLWIGLRSFRLIFCALLTLLSGLALTTAFSAWAVVQLNMISIAFAVLYIGLGVDYAIHFTLKYNEFLKEHLSPFDAMRESFQKLSAVLILSALSTAFGFYAFVPTSFNGVSELGIIAGTGMIISFIATFTLLPALLSLFYTSAEETSPATLSAPFSEGLSSLLTHHTKLLRVTGIVSAALSLILLTKIKFDYNPINLRNPHTESVATMNELIKSGNFTPWHVQILAPDSNVAEEKTNQLADLKEVGRVISVFSFVPKHQAPKLALIQPLQSRYENIQAVTKDSASYVMKNQIEAIQTLQKTIKHLKKTNSHNLRNLQFTLSNFLDTLASAPIIKRRQLVQHVEKDLLKTFPATLQRIKKALNTGHIALKNLPDDLRKRWVTGSGKYRIEASPAPGYGKNNKQLRVFAAAVVQQNPKAAGNLVTIIKSSDAVVKAFIEAIIYALFVITLLLLAYLRSLKYTLYILLPITLAAMMTGVTMVLLGLQFNFANIIALPLLFGLGVDNGVHIVHQAQKRNLKDQGLLKTTTTRAIFFSALTTLFSFGNLAFSPHPGTASMGIILTLGLIFILVSTLLILPAFLMDEKIKA